MSPPRFNPNLEKVPLYIGGKSIEEVKESLGLDEVIKLASNESPTGPSPKALDAIRNNLQDIHRYPGTGDRDLRRKLAARFGARFTEDHFVTGNGGSDILRMITQSFVFDGGNTVMSTATFPLYHIFTTMFGGESRQVPLRPDYHHDLDAMLEQIDDDTRIVFLCSPNNPTGQIITKKGADRFLNAVPEHVIVVFDESYSRYVTDPDYPRCQDYVLSGKNVVVVRSFSKVSGLADLRVGYLLAREELAKYILHTRLPFHTSDLVLAAAAASMDDEDFHVRNRIVTLQGRARLHEGVRALGLTCLDSQMNSVLILDPPIPPEDLTAQLLMRGIIVRHTSAFGLPNGIRVTVGSTQENELFLNTLEEVLYKAGQLKHTRGANQAAEPRFSPLHRKNLR